MTSTHGDELKVRFTGPFSWVSAPDSTTLFSEGVPKHFGIYLWAVSLPDGYLVSYVGETGRSFTTRMVEHYKELASCMYHLYEPQKYSQGEKVPIWPGRYDKADRKTPQECIEQYSALNHVVSASVRSYRFLLAPLDCDKRLRRRVEAAIASTLMSVPGKVGEFLDEGIVYQSRREEEDPVEVSISSSVKIHGLPGRLIV